MPELLFNAPLRVGLVGAGMMGRTHSTAWATVSTVYWPAHPPIIRHRLADATPELAAEGAARLGWAESTGDWHEVTRAPDIDIVDVVVPNALHHDVVLDAVSHGKHVLCEKPLSTDLGEARAMLAAARAAGVVHRTGFIYRLFPAIVLARKLIADGRIGEVRYFRGQWLSDWAADPMAPHGWRFVRRLAGAGVLADTGSHVIDLARYLVDDEVERVLARSETFVTKRPLPSSPSHGITDRPVVAGAVEYAEVDTDDLTDLMLHFEGGASGTISLARAYPGHNTDMAFEVVGSRGSVRFSWLHGNELQFFTLDDPDETRGVRIINIGPLHPNAEPFWGRGTGIGYSDAFLVQAHAVLDAIHRGGTSGASFLDGLRAAEVIDAALRSAERSSWVDVERYEVPAEAR